MNPCFVRIVASMLSFLLVLLMTPSTRGDEGFWLFNEPPLKRLQEKYHFTPDASWLEHFQKSSVRFDNGGSGSFVSADGLVITNQHVGADALQKLSDAQHNYVRDGFYAATPVEEKRCLDLELNVLESIEDVTARVTAAVLPGTRPEEAVSARRKAIAEIEQESTKATGLRSDVVTFFEGASYQLYRYQRYTDVRLVFAPDQGIASFGGDPDNFEYPRYDLDICFFRVYENNRPIHPRHYLRVSTVGPSEHELVLVSGNPGRTNRRRTAAELEERRDVVLRLVSASIDRTEVLLTTYSERSTENARRAREDLLGAQNFRKECDGMLAGLLDPETLPRISERENGLKSKAQGDPRFSAVADSYTQIRRSISADPGNTVKYMFYEDLNVGTPVVEAVQSSPLGFYSQLFRIARALVRATEEREKPNERRLPEYRDSARPVLELALFSETPIYDDFEILTLTDSLTNLASNYGVDDPVVRDLLQGKSPHERAYELVKGTRLKAVQLRRRLYDGGAAIVSEAADSMTEFARAADKTARQAGHSSPRGLTSPAFGLGKEGKVSPSREHFTSDPWAVYVRKTTILSGPPQKTVGT